MKSHILLGLLLLGCSHESRRIDDPELDGFVTSLPISVPPIKERYLCKDGIRIDSSFTSDERALIQEAMNLWNYYTDDSDLIHENAKGANCNLTKGDLEFPDLEITSTRGTITISNETWDYCRARFDTRDTQDGCYRMVFTHELGHSMGIGHLPDDGFGIMTPAQTSLVFTESDLNLCKAVRVCPESMQLEMHYMMGIKPE